MRLKLRGDEKTEIVDVDRATKVEDLRSIVVEKFNLDNFQLSLNKKDFFGDENSYLCQLSFLGITDGDIIYITNLDNCETNPAPSPKKIVPATAPKDPGPTNSRSSNEKPVIAENFDYSMKKFKADLEILLTEANATNELESLVVLIHLLLVEKGFRQKSGSRKLAENWRNSSSNGFFRLNYCHPSSDVELQVGIIANPAQFGDKFDSVVIDGGCKVGDNWEHVRHELFLSKIFTDIQSGSALGHFLNLDKLISELQKFFIDEITIKVIGYVDCLLLQLPDVMVEKIISRRNFSLKMFKNLTETCRKMQKMWWNEKIWGYILKRDFGVDAVNRAEQFSVSYKNEYETIYKNRREAEKRRNPFPSLYEPPHPGWNPNPPGYDPWNPEPQRPYLPMVGGPEDLWPVGGPYQPPLFGMRPNIRPRLPLDPRPPFPRYPGRHPNPNNPDFPNFPGAGGGFI